MREMLEVVRVAERRLESVLEIWERGTFLVRS